MKAATLISLSALIGTAMAGTVITETAPVTTTGFENARRPISNPTLFDLVAMRDELETIFGREVDLLTRPGVERGLNRTRRRAILSSAEPLYLA